MEKNAGGIEDPAGEVTGVQGVCGAPVLGVDQAIALGASDRGHASFPAFETAWRGYAIDRFRQQVSITEPFDRFGSRGAVIDDPAAGPLGTVGLSHRMCSSFASMGSALAALRQYHSNQLLTALPRFQIDALEEFRERHAVPTFPRVINYSQQNHIAAH